MNLILGSHVSFKKDNQLLGSTMEAISYGSNTFMLYTGAPQNTNRESINDEFTYAAYQLMKDNNIDLSNIVVHAPYIINLANEVNRSFAVSFLRQEIERCSSLGITKLVIHPGSHVGLGIEQGINSIISVLNEVITSDQSVYICLETMSGKGSECGKSFEEIKLIIDGVKYSDKVLVCLDTCHLNDAGYDIAHFDEILKSFDQIIGINKIGCIHINDSKNERGVHKDRHENIGFGTIGFDNLLKVIYNPLLENVPKILETPYVSMEDNKYPPYKWEIKMIRERKFDEDFLKHVIS